jgi:hypothetical protein
MTMQSDFEFRPADDVDYSVEDGYVYGRQVVKDLAVETFLIGPARSVFLAVARDTVTLNEGILFTINARVWTDDHRYAMVEPPPVPELVVRLAAHSAVLNRLAVKDLERSKVHYLLPAWRLFGTNPKMERSVSQLFSPMQFEVASDLLDFANVPSQVTLIPSF